MRGPITGMTGRWNNFWFEPAGPENLGFCRLLFFAALLMLFGPREYAALGELSGAFWQPLPLFRRLSLPLFSAEVLAGMAILWKIALLLSCVGLLTRASTGIAFVLGVYLIGLPYNFGVLSHRDAVIVFILGILAFSRSGDAWSVDRLLRGRRRRQITEVSPFNGEYTWPIRMAWLLMAIVFFAAGLAKLQTSGFEWVSSGTLAKFIVRASDPLSTGSAYALAPALGLSLVQVPWLIYLMAAGTLMIELGYPLALVSSRLRVFITVSACLMLIGVRLVMGPPFWPLIACHLFWVPWDRVNRRLFSFITRVQEPPSTRPARQDQDILVGRF